MERQIPTVQSASGPVADIAHQRETAACKLQANLMRSPREQLDLHERYPLFHAAGLPPQFRPPSALALRIGEPGPAVHLGDEVDPRAVTGQLPFHQGQIPLFDRTLPELMGQARGRLGCPRKHEQPGSGPIDPVDQPEEDLARFVESLTQEVLAPRQQIEVAAAIRL